MWGALSDKRTGLSFTTAAGPRQPSHSRVRVPWHSWPYFTLSNSRLPFSSPPTTGRVTVEVFDPASTRVVSSVGQFSPWGRFWSNRMDITSFNSRVIAFFAVTMLWRFVAVWTETFLHATWPCTQCIASSVVFVAVETCCNNSPSSSGAFRVVTGTAQGRLQLSGVTSQYAGLWLLY
jgi:hypothetical protein